MALSALSSGADSVYVGPKGWSRRPAENELTDPEIRDVIAYAAETGKEVRMAVNVMPCPEEIPMFLRKVELYLGWGARGVMVCDPGCIRLVRDHFPEVDIHVSVTAGVFNIEDIHFYRDMGANLVILPYRWGAAEIEEMRDKADVGLEAFLFQTPHRGRICPGRCIASGYFHIRRWRDRDGKDHCIGSASRGGSCHRICRPKWDLTIGGRPDSRTPRLKSSPYLLLWEVPQYVQLGVACFKIPGRERSVDLVCSLVRFYREVIDHVLAGHQEVAMFAAEWEHLKERWLVERVSRDERRLARAEDARGAPTVAAQAATLGNQYV